jgi:hypothetical protein
MHGDEAMIHALENARITLAHDWLVGLRKTRAKLEWADECIERLKSRRGS